MRALLMIVLLMSGYAASAQTDKTKDKPKREVFTQVSQMPEFPGGVDSLYHFLRMNTIYPREAVDDGVEGKVVVQFIVTETGELEEIQVRNSVSKELDEEAIRVVKAMPKWKPGSQNAHRVAVLMTIPVDFEISD